jgi:dihydrofolate synthase / folylpolyglutamate synthase
MTYPETLDYLYQQLPMYQRIGKAAYKADLQSTVDLMKILDAPEKGFKSIHVAGTNGKGSTSHLIASIFQEAGYKTGLYTSPHLIDFRERIKINGHMIPEDHVTQFVESKRTIFGELDLSFFEWSVGLAFDYFRSESVDMAIIEVGMGGRLDSTNVVHPELSIITNIGSDHSQFLGDTAAKIAQEKAGIIKKNVPVIIGRSQRETEGIFRKISLHLDAPIIFADHHFPDEFPRSPLLGNYQKENFQTTLVAAQQLKQQGWNLNDEHISNGFKNVVKNTKLRGRWEVIQESPKVICDVAHNVEGLSIILDQLQAMPRHELHLVLGFVNDKNVGEILGLIPKDAILYLCEPSIPRALHIDKLAQLASDQDLKHTAHNDVASAVHAARTIADARDVIFVGGSTFVVADLLSL